ncbi:MAG TPA: DUF2071 domain-containing protein [Gemmatimonadota bacterium]|nr:DUF2071 domain-containing protein [Gemmatimonadota bacterium]
MRSGGVFEGKQSWRRLLFLHWPVPCGALRGVVPEALPLDLLNGSAWVSIIAFDIRSARPPLVPSPLGIDFLETNVRTYVRLPGGEPAIWFFTLEASSALAVAAARLAYGLPYRFARMARDAENGAQVYRSVRRQGPGAPGIHVRYRVASPRPAVEPGSLEEFLIERYVLHVVRRGVVRTVRVRHRPYPLRDVEVEAVTEDLLAAGGVERPDVAPLAHFSDGVDVDVLRVVGGSRCTAS